MKELFILVLALGFLTANAQLSQADSSVQVVAYWKKNEKQAYNVVSKKYKVVNGDTADVESTKYKVEVTVLDSTAKSYTVEWLYKNYDVTKANNLVQSIADVSKDMKVIIKTDELGALQGVVNWEEIRDEVRKGFAAIRSQMKDTRDADVLIKNLEAQFSTKQAIETTVIPDILQFYTFHGGKYVVSQPNETKTVSNGIPGHPVDVTMTVWVSAFDRENDFSTVVVQKAFDQKQMTDATYALMKNMTKSSKVKAPSRESIGEITFTDATASQVHGSSGWVIYSFSTRKTSQDDQMKVEEREIDLEIL